MNDKLGNLSFEYIVRILKIVDNCEKIQKGNDSDYTKEQAKVSAYNEIAEMLGARKEKD